MCLWVCVRKEKKKNQPISGQGSSFPEGVRTAILASRAVSSAGEILGISKLCVHYRITVGNCFKAESYSPGKF